MLPTITAYEEAIRPEVEQRLGPRFSKIFPIVGTLFPNFSFLRASARTFRVWHPRGPDKVEVWACIYVDKAAPRSEGGLSVVWYPHLQPFRDS